MPIKLNMENVVFGKLGQLSSQPMTAYLECGSCKTQSTIQANTGEIKCPSCGSSHIGLLSMGGSKPSWFKGEA